MATGLLNTIRRLVDAGFPESTAQKIATGELPMDEASRMARAAEQGYTIPAYTGAKTGDIMAFDPNMGRRGRTDTGTWFSQEPQISNTYAGSIDGGTVYPVLLRNQGLTEVDAGGQNWSRIMPDTPIRHSSGAQTRAGELTGDVLFQDYTNTNDIARLARRQGDEGVRFYNVQDRGPYMGGVENVPPTADNLAIFNPANIRSRFAAFDPDQISNPNILAGGAGILGVGLMASEDAQAREPELFWDKITESLGLSTKQSDLASEIQGLLPTMNQPRVPGGSTAEMYDNQPIGFWGEGHANPQDPNWQAVASNFWRNRVADAMAAPGFLADVVDLPTTFMSRQLEPEQDIPYFRRSGRAYDATQQGLSLLFGEPVPVEDPQTAGFLAMTDVASAAVPGLLASTAPQAIRAGQRISRAAEELGETVGRNIQNYQPMTPGSPRAQIGAVGDLTPQSGLLAERPANIPEGQALQFLHNTSVDKLMRQERMGGMPMPSVAVTREDVPFDAFGDITLVGKKEAFDPRVSRTNEIFSADAYTVRSPSPIRLARKDAVNRFKEDFDDVAEQMQKSILSEQYELESLASRSGASESAYRTIDDFFNYSDVPAVKFLQKKGVTLPTKDDRFSIGRIDGAASYDLAKTKYQDEFAEWINNQKEKYLEGKEYFISNPDRDYVMQKPKFVEYTANNITNYMKKRSGRGQEGGMSATGIGAQRAATTEQLPTMRSMQERRGDFVPREEVSKIRGEQQDKFFELTDDLREFYQYNADGFRYLDEVSDMITISERKGLAAALEEVGFKNASPEVIAKIDQYKDLLRSSPVQYFEAKPKRTVQLQEFEGAIVPANTPQSVIDMLKSKGIRVEKYKNEEERLKLREKFPTSMFSAAPAIPGAGLLAPQEEPQQNTPTSLMDF